MTEDLLSQLANPQRYAMLKERGAIDEKAIQAQAQQQDRAQNLRQGQGKPPQNNSQPVNQVQEVKQLPPDQNTLMQFSKKEQVKQDINEFVQNVPAEPKRDPEPRPIQLEPPRDEPVRNIFPVPKREEQVKSRLIQDEDIMKVESLFKRLINNG